MLHTRGWHEMKLGWRSFGKGETNGEVGVLDNLHTSRYLRSKTEKYGERLGYCTNIKWKCQRKKKHRRMQRLGGYRFTAATTFVSDMWCVGIALWCWKVTPHDRSESVKPQCGHQFHKNEEVEKVVHKWLQMQNPDF